MDIGNRIENMFWGTSQLELIHDTMNEILRLRKTIKELETRIAEIEPPEFTDYNIRWQGEITFKVTARNGVEGIEWIDEVLNEFCADNDATYKTNGHIVTGDFGAY